MPQKLTVTTSLAPHTVLILIFVAVLFGILIGGTIGRARREDTWDTITTVLFIVIAGVAVFYQALMGIRVNGAVVQLREKFDCIQNTVYDLRAHRIGPQCRIEWDD